MTEYAGYEQEELVFNHINIMVQLPEPLLGLTEPVIRFSEGGETIELDVDTAHKCARLVAMRGGDRVLAMVLMEAVEHATS